MITTPNYVWAIAECYHHSPVYGWIYHRNSMVSRIPLCETCYTLYTDLWLDTVSVRDYSSAVAAVVSWPPAWPLPAWPITSAPLIYKKRKAPKKRKRK